MSISITNKVALVTGANRGIGKAIVDSLIQHGVSKVYLAVRTLTSTQELVAAYAGKVVPIEVDMSKPETIRNAASVASDVEIAINNAGVLETASPLADDVFEAFEKELKVNVYGLLHFAQAFAPVLKSNGGGALVQLNSVASMKSFADFATYSASKAAAYSFTQGLRDKLQEQGTDVISVHPGPISTDMANNAGLGEIAEPPSLVSEAIMTALESGEFHVFPDSMAKMFYQHYEPFAKNIAEANLMEA